MLANLVCALVMAAVAARLVPGRCSRTLRAGVVALVLVWMLLPFPWGGAGWVLAFAGHFSLTSLLLALAALVCRLHGRALVADGEMRALCALVLVTALVFYPSSLGAISFDAYALGFGDFRFSTALLLLGMAAWIVRAYAGCVVLIVAQCGYAIGALPSDNLWDYLLDPWLVFWAAGWLLSDLRRRLAAAGAPAAT